MTKHNIEYLFVFFLFITVIFSCNNVHAKDGISLLRKYNFDDGTYTIVGLICHEQGNKIQNTLRDFYIKDIDILNKLKKTWKTDNPSPFFACGYHYNIFILKNGKTQESFSINLEKGCNTVVTEYGQFYFEPSHIENLIGVAIQAKKEQKKFKTLRKARDYYLNLAKNKNLLFVHTPKWEKFDGEFRFSVNCEKKFYIGISSEKCVKNVSREIQDRFPNELFLVQESGSSSGPEGNKIFIKVQSTKKLYDEFNLYSIDWKWNEYEPILTVFWQ